MFDRSSGCFECEIDSGTADSASDLRLSDSRDHCTVVHECHAVTGLKKGIATSSCSSKTTSTAIPTSTAFTSTSTIQVVRRTSGASSSSTAAITYGGGESGNHGVWLMVIAATLPLPHATSWQPSTSSLR